MVEGEKNPHNSLRDVFLHINWHLGSMRYRRLGPLKPSKEVPGRQVTAATYASAPLIYVQSTAWQVAVWLLCAQSYNLMKGQKVKEIPDEEEEEGKKRTQGFTLLST